MKKRRFTVHGSRFTGKKKTACCFLLTAICFLLPAPAAAQINPGVRAFTSLTGEVFGSLDNVDIYDLVDKEIALGTVSNVLYVYQYNATSTSCSPEVSPTYLQPKNFSTAGCWHLVSQRTTSVDTGRGASPCWNFGDSDTTDSDTNGSVCLNCITTGSGAEDCEITISTQVDGTLAARFKITANGGVTPVRKIYPKTAAYTITAYDMGAVFTNLGATGTVVLTLPEASTVLGQEIWFHVLANYTLNINPADATDYIPGMTNSAGDSVAANAAGASLGLRAVGNDTWAPIGPYGTWTDAN